MRRTVSAILILAVFCCLQYGKIASFLYCKWQKEVVQGQPDCGCDKHLVSIFDHGTSGSNDSLAKSSFNEKIIEYSTEFLIEIPEHNNSVKLVFTEYNSPLAENFIAAPFHPPLI